MALRSYRELESWRHAIDLVEQVYVVTESWPDRERYGLVSQVRRAAVSVPANIAEGYGRMHRKEYIHHLSMARGSLAEVETHLVIAVRIGMAERESLREVWRLAQRVGRMLGSQLRGLRRNAATKSSPQSPVPSPQTPQP